MSLTDTLQTIRQPILALREQIAPLNAQIDALRAKSLNRSESKAALATWLDQQTAAGEAALNRLASAVQWPDSPPARPADPGEWESLLFALQRPAIETRMNAAIDAAIPSDAPTRATLTTQLASLEAQVRTLEQQEELLIRRLEESGMPVGRRRNAKPDIVLSELE